MPYSITSPRMGISEVFAAQRRTSFERAQLAKTALGDVLTQRSDPDKYQDLIGEATTAAGISDEQTTANALRELVLTGEVKWTEHGFTPAQPPTETNGTVAS